MTSKNMPIEEKIQRNIVLAPHTTFKIGGSAKFFIEIKFGEELALAVDWAKKNKENIYILGGGSNTLISDAGLDGLVIKLSNDDIANLNPRIHAGAGASLNSVLSLARANNFSGLEWSTGIPRATVGGSIRGNAGAFGSSMADIVETVEVFNINKNRFEFLSHNDCDFSYRSSIFKKDKNLIVWATTLKMKLVESREMQEKTAEVLKFRDEKQPRLPSAGSIFKNLLLEDIKKINDQLYLHIVENKLGKDGKIGAGFIIDYCGLKGKRIGDAKISLEHANFIVNAGRATAKDVMDLIDFIKKDVERKTGVDLEEEIVLLK